MNPLVSIICPVFNAELYLPRCLNSIIAQSLVEWECILVDDGSTDNSAEICDVYAARDARFHVIHKSNGGVSSARQRGVDEAVGEYSIHVDPDDYIEPEMLKEMFEIIKERKIDILITDFYLDRSGKDTVLLNQYTQDKNSSELIKSILNQKIHGSLCNKMISLSCYKSYGVSFPEGLNYCEDVIIWAQLAKYSLRVGYYPKAYYHYVYNPVSITHVYSDETYRQRKLFINIVKSILNGQEFVDSIRKAEFDVFFEAWKKYYFNKDNAKNEMKKYRYFITSSKTGLRVKIACILILFGFDKLAHKLFLL